MKEIIIYEFQLKEIIEALRITKRITKEKNLPETAYDRIVNNAYQYAQNALENKKDVLVSFGKNQI